LEESIPKKELADRSRNSRIVIEEILEGECKNAQVEPAVARALIPNASQRIVEFIWSFAATRRNWIVELWRDNRQIFKELVKHTVVFLLFVAALTLSEKILKYSSLADDRKSLLDKVEFYGSIIALVIFFGSFIIKVMIWEFNGIRGHD
jgi:hypothetical protein